MKNWKNNNKTNEEIYLNSSHMSSIIYVILIIALFFLLFTSCLTIFISDNIKNASPISVGDPRTTYIAEIKSPNSPNKTISTESGVASEIKTTIHSEKVLTDYISEEERHVEDDSESIFLYSNDPLTASKGRNNGPSGEETWYNLDMIGVVSNMRNLGFDQDSYPYWVRGDNVKMLGNYVMVAANLNIRPKGTILETSLGLGIVCDTGKFVANNPTQIDIATNW